MFNSRRFFSLGILGLLISMTTISCSSLTKDAVRFDDQSLSTRELDDLLVGYATAVPAVFADSGNIDIGVTQGIIQNWIATQATIRALKEAGVDISDQDRVDARDKLSAEAGFTAAPQNVRDFYVLGEAAQMAATRTFQPDREVLRKDYEELGIESGVVCIRAILTQTRADMDQVVFRLDAGEDFAAVARETSIDATGADGGALTNQTTGSKCLDLTEFQGQAAPELVSVLNDSLIGKASAPFEITGVGWIVLLIRPFDEVADDIANLIGANATTLPIQNALSLGKVWVSAEYGRWDSQSLSVQPLE